MEYEPEPRNLSVPPEQEPGAYAEFVNVWHTDHAFTLDFGAPMAEAGEAIVTARVRLPATGIFDVIRALNYDMTVYERQFGEIRRPQERD